MKSDLLKSSLVSIAIFGIVAGSHQGIADEGVSPGSVFDQVRTAEMTSRRISGGVNIGVGLTLAAVPMFSSDLDSGAKLLFALGGVTVLLNGVKNLFVPTQVERVAGRYSALRKSNYDSKTSTAYEEAFLEEVLDSSKANRYWQSIIALGGGAATLAAGLLQDNAFARNFSVIMGGMSVFGGVMMLINKSEVERIVEQHQRLRIAGVNPILFQSGRSSVVGLMMTASF